MDVAAVKKLNSTFGTPNYKPLDELIMVGSKRLVASDINYAKLDFSPVSLEGKGNGYSTGTATATIVSFKPIVDGSVRLFANMDLYDSVDSTNWVAYGCLYVYINGTLKNTFMGASSGAGTSTTNVNVSGDITLNKGDAVTIKFQVKASADTSTMSYRGTLNSI